ncbi:unnamed protein product [Brachionus calyciflorus]|uniref:G-protein coupled receptors family 1 profile domain-containing protein n=1 Tax=Brachionus calyciflorus TaxID=104777 RepID=A0A813YVC6_9BILA|nr:unnamed protein product [Brachionus calyciflorus]
MIVLDSSLQLSLNKQDSIAQLNFVVFINIVNIISFDLYSNTFSKIFINYPFNLNFFYSHLKVLPNLNSPNKNISLFQSVFVLSFGFTVKYYLNTTSLIFQNANLNKIEFHGLSDSFLNRNILSFTTLNSTLNSKIVTLALDMYNFKLSTSLIDPNLFKTILILTLKGTINSINSNLFTNLLNLSSIDFDLVNFPYFLTPNTGWLKKMPNKRIRITIKNDGIYKFPNSDLCLFKSFENFSFVITPKLDYCTCTIIWLLKNTSLPTMRPNCTLINCNFETIFKSCKFYKIKKETSNYYNEINRSQYLNFITVVFTPLFGLIGLVTNIINIIALSLIDSITKSSEQMNRLMLINSILNLIYSIIYLFSLINKCVYFTGLFCSSINKTYSSQIFDIIFIKFLANILKLMTNLSIIGISLLRLITLIKDKSIMANIGKFLKQKFSRILLILGLFGFLVSLDQFFINDINENLFIVSAIDYEKFPNENTFMNEISHFFNRRVNSNIKYTGAVSYVFFIIYMLNFIVNDILLYVIMLVVDLALIFYLKESIDLKKKLAFGKFGLNKIGKRKIKITAVILMNSLILFSLRLVHFVFSVYVFKEKLYSNKNGENVCFLYSLICTNYKEFGEFLYFVSNVYSIVLFYNLNINFKRRIQKILHIRSPKSFALNDIKSNIISMSH